MLSSEEGQRVLWTPAEGSPPHADRREGRKEGAACANDVAGGAKEIKHCHASAVDGGVDGDEEGGRSVDKDDGRVTAARGGEEANTV
jgi:hypothetical protein